MTGSERREGTTAPVRRILRRVGFFIGLALLVAAVAVVWRQRETLNAALEAAASAPLAVMLLLPATVAANVVLTAVFLGILMARYGRVGRLEMQAVVAAATLMNYLPLRPGLLGRVAYHRAVNRIPVADSARSVLEAAGVTTLIAAYLAVVVFVSMRRDLPLTYGVAAPLPVLLAGFGWRGARLWMAAALVRYVEVLVWAVRYHLAFALIGSSIDAHVALAFACASVIATLVPFVSNGLGLREWAIGLLAPVLTAYHLEVGVTAELVNRAAEIAVIVVTGLAGMAWLARRGSDPAGGSGG